MKCYSNVKNELKNLEGTLQDNYIMNGERIYIELGVPLGREEVPFKFILFKYTKDSSENLELFHLNINGLETVKEGKRIVVDHFNKLKAENPDSPLKDIDLGGPENIRFRYMLSRSPSTVITDDQLMKDVSKMIMYAQEVAVQILPNSQVEDKISRDTVVSFFQRFYPETYELGDRFEINVEFDEELDTLRRRISERTQCDNIHFLESDRIDNVSLLNLKNMNWFKPIENVDDDPTKFKPKVRLLRPRDGNLVLFKSGNEHFKELNPQDKKIIQDRETALKGSNRYFRIEKNLKIVQQDVDIDDDPSLKIDTTNNNINNGNV